jgi:hypothetical protein
MEKLNLNSNTEIFSAKNITKYWRDIQPSLNSSQFTDETFPPNHNSLYSKNENGEYVDVRDGKYYEDKLNFYGGEFGWKRASEIFKGVNNCFIFEDEIDPNDIMQGKLGDCYFLAAISAIAKFPSLIKQLFRTEEINEQGFYEIVMFIDGEWQIVFIDDYFPVINGIEMLFLLVQKIMNYGFVYWKKLGQK